MNEGHIVYHGTPDEAMNTLQGKVYQKIVSRDTLDAYAGQYQLYQIKW